MWEVGFDASRRRGCLASRGAFYVDTFGMFNNFLPIKGNFIRSIVVVLLIFISYVVVKGNKPLIAHLIAG